MSTEEKKSALQNSNKAMPVDKFKENNLQLPMAVHAKDQKLSKALRRIKNKIFVMSGKGGVGKSSVTCNLACALDSLGYKVGILDFDIHGPSIPRLLGIEEEKLSFVGNNQLQPIIVGKNLKILSLDTLLEDRSKAVIWRGPKKSNALKQFIADTKWDDLDFLLIDSPPGTGDEHMTVLKNIPDVLCLMVSTAQKIAVADVRKAFNFVEISKGQLLGLVENMSIFNCPHCDGKIDFFGSENLEKLASEYSTKLLCKIPFDVQAAICAENGEPIAWFKEKNAAKDAFFELAKSVQKFCTNQVKNKDIP